MRYIIFQMFYLDMQMLYSCLILTTFHQSTSEVRSIFIQSEHKHWLYHLQFKFTSKEAHEEPLTVHPLWMILLMTFSLYPIHFFNSSCPKNADVCSFQVYKISYDITFTILLHFLLTSCFFCKAAKHEMFVSSMSLSVLSLYFSSEFHFPLSLFQ